MKPNKAKKVLAIIAAVIYGIGVIDVLVFAIWHSHVDIWTVLDPIILIVFIGLAIRINRDKIVSQILVILAAIIGFWGAIMSFNSGNFFVFMVVAGVIGVIAGALGLRETDNSDNPNNQIAENLKNLETLYERGLITQVEYQERRSALLDKL